MSVISRVYTSLDPFLSDMIQQGAVPGAVLSVGDLSGNSFRQAYGFMRTQPYMEKMSENTIFDLASLTKVICTWPAILKLIDEKRIDFATPLGDIDANIMGCAVEKVTIGQLLLHVGGLSERTWLIQYGTDRHEIYRGLCNKELDFHPGTRVAYSNRGFILLGYMVERITGESLDQYVSKNIWDMLDMSSTSFNPIQHHSIAPTEYDSSRHAYLCGVVHDENARILGGVSGHAGVFSNVYDIEKICKMILNKGNYNGKQVLNEKLILSSFQNLTKGLNEERGYGWQKCQAVPHENSLFRHLGFTGTAIWIDIVHGVYAILLSNRIHPSRECNLHEIQNIRAYIQSALVSAFPV